MKQYITLVLAGSVGAWLAANEALAQQKSPLVGAWTFVSSTTKGPEGGEPENCKSAPWGLCPKVAFNGQAHRSER